MKKRWLWAGLGLCLLVLAVFARLWLLTDGLLLPGQVPSENDLPPLLTHAPAFSETAEDGLLNINQADEQALMQLPGIGETLARRIVEYRRSYGDFSALEELMAVEGMGPARLARLRPYATVK